MSRIFKVLLSFCLVFCLLPSHAFAANTTYELEELGMSIELPSNHVVFTRDIKANDPNLSAYGLTKDGMSSLMLERNIYLNAWDEDVNYEIIVTMVDSPFEDYNQFSNTTLNGFASALETEYASMGITFIRSELYQHSQAKFVKIYISQPNNGDTAYGLQYHTVYNGKAINITLQSYSGEIDSSREASIQKIVDTIRFDTKPQFSAPPAQTKAFTYTDKDSGMTFTVPANWIESPMNEDREYIDVKFTSNLEEGLCIIFSSQDVYELEDFKAELSATEQLLLTRDVIGNDIFTKADIAEMYGCKEKDVLMVTYGDKEYYTAEVIKTDTSYGIPISVPMVYLLRCENGYMYMFQFNGTKDSPYFDDFINLISSAKYPVIADEMLFQRRTIGIVFILVLIVLAIICVFAVQKRRSQKGSIECSVHITASTYNEENNQNETFLSGNIQKAIHKETDSTGNSSVIFCHKCGAKVKYGSQFCHKCGAKLFTEEGK
ncbi:MAG: zinc ribbon domain-containing protein [Candidatus Fimivivens sp.]|nr:zinc ribbon domain-containing protein [Candidatus Fimivivens sp.]